MANKLDHKIALAGSTTGASTAVLGSYAVPDESVIQVVARVNGRTTAGESLCLVQEGAFDRDGGTLSLIGSLPTLRQIGINALLTTALLTIVVNGTSIDIRFTGVATYTIALFGVADILVWTP